ncbi:cupin domain-containing protein [Sinirhodobacter sp. WL0062]|uniref:Cupin domain-containing protein n=1 Tax=Rhodobacter flavimaris TaxID=2907145 RepID=A0ABS8YTV9_9RHOB|nr:cupin domain-containing protein [Sinirhodobacter sp. WL0062]MCE5972525.1 cupin domain-containing protein [Sinirhodobacter sp. WL0062]
MPVQAKQPDLNIGHRLRAVRTQERLSQRELARRSGVTNGLISQIETNHSSPSVASLKRILDAIPMSLAEFFGPDSEDRGKICFRARELLEIDPRMVFRNAPQAASIALHQVGIGPNRMLQILHERYEPGADTGMEKYSHEGEEGGFVLSGWIELTVGDEVNELGPGDAYLFDSRIPHRFRNLRDEVCVLVSACTPPSF